MRMFCSQKLVFLSQFLWCDFRIPPQNRRETALFFAISRRRVAISYRRFRTTYRFRKAQFTIFEVLINMVGRFHPFHRPRKPLGRVELLLYSVFRPRYWKGVRGQRHAPAAFNARERHGTHCTGGWVGPRTGLDRRGKSRPHRYLIPGPSSP
jgi:hypothetical protein